MTLYFIVNEWKLISNPAHNKSATNIITSFAHNVSWHGYEKNLDHIKIVYTFVIY